MKRHPKTLKELLCEGPAPRARALPPPKTPTEGYALKVYRSQLVEERTLAVKRLSVRTVRDCAEVIWDYLGEPDRETCVVLLLDRANVLLGLYTVAIGDHDSVFVAPRQVYKAALLANADRIIVAHNHVNDDVRPSEFDKTLTAMLLTAGRALDVQLCDHVIVGRSPKHCFSFLDAGLIPENG